MQPEQQVIASWIARVMREKGWTAETWAREAGISPTTITRALKPDYESITNIKTLDGLAKAAEVSSVLDFLADPETLHAVPEPMVPSAKSLSGLLAAILPLAPKGRQTAQSLRVVAAALSHGLELLGDQSASPDNDGALGAAARGAVSRFRDLTRQ